MHRSAREVGTVRTCARPICMRLRLSPTISYNTTKKSRRWTFLSCDIWFRPAFVLRPRLRSFRTWKQPENRHPLPDPLPLSYLVRAQSIGKAFCQTQQSRSASAVDRQDLPPSATESIREQRPEPPSAARPAAAPRSQSAARPAAVRCETGRCALVAVRRAVDPRAETGAAVRRETGRCSPVAVRRETGRRTPRDRLHAARRPRAPSARDKPPSAANPTSPSRPNVWWCLPCRCISPLLPLVCAPVI